MVKARSAHRRGAARHLAARHLEHAGARARFDDITALATHICRHAESGHQPSFGSGSARVLSQDGTRGAHETQVTSRLRARDSATRLFVARPRSRTNGSRIIDRHRRPVIRLGGGPLITPDGAHSGPVTFIDRTRALAPDTQRDALRADQAASGGANSSCGQHDRAGDRADAHVAASSHTHGKEPR